MFSEAEWFLTPPCILGPKPQWALLLSPKLLMQGLGAVLVPGEHRLPKDLSLLWLGVEAASQEKWGLEPSG